MLSTVANNAESWKEEHESIRSMGVKRSKKALKDLAEKNDTPYSKKAQEFLGNPPKRKDSFAKGAQNILLQDKYFCYAKELLADFPPESFQNLFPRFYPAKQVFPQIYSIVGPYLRDVHEHMMEISEKAETLREDSPERAPVVQSLEELVEKHFGQLQEQAANPGSHVVETGFSFIDRIIDHMLTVDDTFDRSNMARVTAHLEGGKLISDILSIAVDDILTRNEDNALIERLIQKTLQCIHTAPTEDEEAIEAHFQTSALSLFDVAFPDELWKTLIPPMLRSMVSKEMITKQIAPYLRAVSESKKNLESERGAVEAKLPDEVKRYINREILPLIQESVAAIGRKEAPMIPGGLDFLDQITKATLSANSRYTKALRDGVISDAVYAVVGQLFVGAEGTPPEDVMMAKLTSIVTQLQDQENWREESAKVVLDELLPDALLDRLVHEKFRPYVSKDDIADSMKQYFMDMHSFKRNLQRESIKGKEKVEALGFEFRKLIDSVLSSTKESMDDTARSEGLLTASLPELFNTVIKKILNPEDATLSPICKGGVDHLVYAILNNAIGEGDAAKKRQNLQLKFLELIEAMNGEDPTLGLLQVLLPNSLFEQHSFRREDITSLLSDYVKEVTSLRDNLVRATTIATEDTDVQRLSAFARDNVHSLAAAEGETIFDQFRQELLATDGPTDGIKTLIDGYINGIVATIVTGLKGRESHLTNKRGFLVHAFNSSLGQLKATPEKAVDLPEGEFHNEAATKLLSIFFPNGAKDFPVPKTAQSPTYKMMASEIAKQIQGLTSTGDVRVKTVMSLLGIEIEAGNKTKFKQALSAFVYSKTQKAVKEYFGNGIIGTLLGHMVAVIAWLVFRLSLAGRLYNFLSNDDNSAPIQRFIWKFLQLANTEVGIDGNASVAESQTGIADKIEQVVRDHRLLPSWMARRTGLLAAANLPSSFSDKRVIDLIGT